MSARAGVARRVAPWRAALVAAWLALLAPATVFADVAVPMLARHVTDQTGTLAAADIARLEQRLVALEARKGSQVAILLVATTQPETIEAYALAVAEKNQLGREKEDDGLLLLVAKDDRKARIEVGYGLEGAIPDAIASRVIREYLAPKFRENDYAGGLEDASAVLEKLIDGEPLPPPMAAEREGGDSFGTAMMIGLLVGFFAAATRLKPALVRMLGAGGVAAVIAAIVLGGGFLLVISAIAAAMMSVVGGGGGGRYVGHGGSWGGGGGYSGGGGGWSGGGGSFGGGGASGGW